MKLEEVINTALAYLGENGYDIGKDKAEDDKIRLLVKCANIMLTEIAQEYLPLSDECRVVAKNNRFYYDEVPRRMLRITSVKDENGAEVKFMQKSFWCNVRKNGALVVGYRYVPATAEIGDDCDVDPRVSEKTLALGTCAEYCMISGMYEQSEGFAERFRQDMRSCTRPVGSVTIKERGWY